MLRFLRIFAITLGLATGGAVAGAVACWLTGVVLAVGYPGQVPEWRAWLDPAIAPVLLFGAVPGAFVGPAVGWTSLRRVPIWLALAAMPPTAAAAILLFVAAGGNLAGFGWLVSALVGVAVATAALNRRYRAPTRERTSVRVTPNEALQSSSTPGHSGAPADSLVGEHRPAWMARN